MLCESNGRTVGIGSGDYLVPSCLFLWYRFVVKSYENASMPWSHHDDVIKWKHFPRYWPFVRGIHRSPVNSAHKDQWRGTLMFSLTCVWINDWVNNREAGDLRRHRGHYDINVMRAIVNTIVLMPVKWSWRIWVNPRVPNQKRTQQPAKIVEVCWGRLALRKIGIFLIHAMINRGLNINLHIIEIVTYS